MSLIKQVLGDITERQELSELKYNKEENTFTFTFQKYKQPRFGRRENTKKYWFTLTSEFCKEQGIINLDKLPENYTR